MTLACKTQFVGSPALITLGDPHQHSHTLTGETGVKRKLLKSTGMLQTPSQAVPAHSELLSITGPSAQQCA